jgi:uncharacterized membrane protein
MRPVPAVDAQLGKSAGDPYPFILLSLLLPILAAIQATVIIKMSQNRQAAAPNS